MTDKEWLEWLRKRIKGHLMGGGVDIVISAKDWKKISKLGKGE